MSKLDFCDLPHDADAPQNATVTDEDAFEGPAEEMSESKGIEMVVELLPGDVRTVHAIFLVHVDFKILEVWIEPVKDSHDGFEVLKHEEEQKHQIQYRQPKNHSPDSWMRSGKWSIRECHY